MLNAGAVGDVVERAVPAVVKQPMAGPAVGGGVGDRPAIDQEDVNPPVPVVVEEDRARAHGLDEVFVGARAVGVVEHDTGLARDIGELRKGRLLCGTEWRTQKQTRHHGGKEDTENFHLARLRSSRSTSFSMARRRFSSASRRDRSYISNCRAASAVLPRRVCAVASAYLTS